MVFETMNRKQLAARMRISSITLWRYMKELDPEFQKQIKGRILFENEVQYIYEQITGSEKWKTGSK
jgi:predicted DNA-binding protein (UPF0251 family)